MIAEIPGDLIAVPLAPARSGDPRKCRPIGLYRPNARLAAQYRRAQPMRKSYDDAAAAEFYAKEENLVGIGPFVERKAPRGPMAGHVPVRFDEATIAAVKTRSEAAGMTVSAWIRNLVARELAAGADASTSWDDVTVVRVPAGTQRVAIEIERCPDVRSRRVGVHASRRDENCGASFVTHRPVVGVPVVVCAARRVKISRSRSRSRSSSTAGFGSSGPISSAVPSTVAHSQPARRLTAIVGSARRWSSLRVPPAATNATTRSPVTG